MRKKSHISLAKYIVDSLAEQELVKHRKAFYLGSILPDCKPSFITVKHEMEGTFPKVQRELEEIVARQQNSEINMRVFYRSLGEVIHYIADYFTFPHNSNYSGSLKDHCIYEKYLKFRLRSYIRERACVLCAEEGEQLYSVEDILDYIRRNHREYMKEFRSVEEDCEYITRVCLQVLAAMVYLVHGPAAATAA